MKTTYLKYGMAFVAVGLGAFSLLAENGWTFTLLIYGFGIIPLAELLIPADEHNMSKAEEAIARADRVYDWMVYMIVPLQYALLGIFIWRITFVENTVLEIIGLTFSMGLACGVFGINVAHELGHRMKKSEQWMAKLLLLTSQYMHFFIEHNRGHHKNVSTDNDPASSRRGEILYTFWVRSIAGSYKSAWELENNRLKKAGKSPFSLENEMLQFQLIQFGFLAIIFGVFGWFTGLMVMAAGLGGILLLETVNYIEHYGLRRERNEKGIYERVMPHHSWNSNHVLGRLMLFELSRHSDHHYRANRQFQILRHFEGAPQMPTGYPGMMLLSTIPPLWFSVMHRHIDQYKSQQNQQMQVA